MDNIFRRYVGARAAWLTTGDTVGRTNGRPSRALSASIFEHLYLLVLKNRSFHCSVQLNGAVFTHIHDVLVIVRAYIGRTQSTIYCVI